MLTLLFAAGIISFGTKVLAQDNKVSASSSGATGLSHVIQGTEDWHGSKDISIEKFLKKIETSPTTNFFLSWSIFPLVFACPSVLVAFPLNIIANGLAVYNPNSLFVFSVFSGIFSRASSSNFLTFLSVFRSVSTAFQTGYFLRACCSGPISQRCVPAGTG